MNTSTTEIYSLSLHDALPISIKRWLQALALLALVGAAIWGLLFLQPARPNPGGPTGTVNVSTSPSRSEEHTSELQSQSNLVCRLLLEKKKEYSDGSHRPCNEE